MLQVILPAKEFFDEEQGQFVLSDKMTIDLEHSLLSISKWESRWKIPFIGTSLTIAQTIDYVNCMRLSKGPIRYFNYLIDDQIIKEVQNYIDDPMTATTVNLAPNEGRKTILTSEVIYYLMFSYGIPKECEKWHLNRLLMLISVFDAKNSPEKKIPKNQISEEYRRLNEIRRKQLGSRG